MALLDTRGIGSGRRTGAPILGEFAVSLLGELKDLPLPLLLQTLAAHQVTGKLTLNGNGTGRRATIVFRLGRIVYAAADGARETIGNILLMMDLVTEAVLLEALRKQDAGADPRPLGRILLEMGALDESGLSAVLEDQVSRVVGQLLEWRQGSVRFDAVEVPDCGHSHVDVGQSLERNGVEVGEPLLDLTRALRADLAPYRRRRSDEPRIDLRSTSAELPCPLFTAEVTFGILRLAAEMLDRGAIFLRTAGVFEGVGQFGIDAEVGAGPTVREIRLDADEPSVLATVVRSKRPHRGAIEMTTADRWLASRLGGQVPKDLAVLPMLVQDEVRLLLWGDNLPTNRPIGDLERLELLMRQGGRSVETGLPPYS